MAATKLSKDQQIALKALIAKLRLRSYTLIEIAYEAQQLIGEVLSKQTIDYYLKQLEAEWQKSAQIDIAQLKAQELAKLGHAEREVWEQWERSKEDAETTTNRNGEYGFDETKTVVQTGDPRYITNLINLSERKAKLLGLDVTPTIAIQQDQNAPTAVAAIIAQYALIQSAEADPATDTSMILPDEAPED